MPRVAVNGFTVLMGLISLAALIGVCTVRCEVVSNADQIFQMEYQVGAITHDGAFIPDPKQRGTKEVLAFGQNSLVRRQFYGQDKPHIQALPATDELIDSVRPMIEIVFDNGRYAARVVPKGSIPTNINFGFIFMDNVNAQVVPSAIVESKSNFVYVATLNHDAIPTSRCRKMLNKLSRAFRRAFGRSCPAPRQKNEAIRIDLRSFKVVTEPTLINLIGKLSSDRDNDGHVLTVSFNSGRTRYGSNTSGDCLSILKGDRTMSLSVETVATRLVDSRLVVRICFDERFVRRGKSFSVMGQTFRTGQPKPSSIDADRPGRPHARLTYSSSRSL